jgi:tRNA (pseudouridine54-N1)-methyltransferase
MRQFIVVGHDAPTTAEFSLSDLPGAGRLDLLARAVTSSLLLSHGIRESVRTYLVLSDQFTVRFEGRELRRLNPDERSTAALVRTALEEREEAIGHMEVETSPGVYLSRLGFETTLDTAATHGTVCQLYEDGTPAPDIEPPENPVFVLSDHRDFTGDELETLTEVREHRLTLGPERLHADRAITVAHNWLDTDGFTSFESR